jgi:hypothetical protein
MINERKTERFEDDRKKWEIYFDVSPDHLKGDFTIHISLIKNLREYPLTKQDLEEPKQDLKDLGKFRIIKQGREFLEK